jgi:hypothetical protein
MDLFTVALQANHHCNSPEATPPSISVQSCRWGAPVVCLVLYTGIRLPQSQGNTHLGSDVHRATTKDIENLPAAREILSVFRRGTVRLFVGRAANCERLKAETFGITRSI